MICPKCKEQGLTSKVTIEGGSTTLLGCPSYYDKDGTFHHHDENTVTEQFRCSNGHVGQRIVRNTCACGWVQKHYEHQFVDGSPCMVLVGHLENGKWQQKAKNAQGEWEIPVLVELTDDELIKFYPEMRYDR